MRRNGVQRHVPALNAFGRERTQGREVRREAGRAMTSPIPRPKAGQDV